MGHELDLMSRTLDKIYAILEANPKAKEKVEESQHELGACPDCGEPFKVETYPYCRYCRIRWD